MMTKHLWGMLGLVSLLTACQSPMPPSMSSRNLPNPSNPNQGVPAQPMRSQPMPSSPNGSEETPNRSVPSSNTGVAPSSRPSANGKGTKIIQIEPRAEGLGDPTEGIDPNTPLETSVTPKLEPLVKGTIKPYIVNGETVTPMASIAPFTQTGIASWYGKKFHGLKTASGEPYNMFKLSGAHQKLPIPSYVRVTNLDNQKMVIVRINDRGPFAHNRIIDLSYAAAKQLDLLKTGSGRVEISLIDPKKPETANPPISPINTASTSMQSRPMVPDLASSGVYLQVGAFSEEQNADRLCQRIERQQPDRQPLVNKVYNGKVFQVVLGPYPDQALASQAANDLREQLQLPAYMFHRP